MPITQSAKKALRQSIRRRAQNLNKIHAYKDALRSVRKLVLAKNFEKATEKLSSTFSALDKAAKTNVITKNKSSRLKSRLMRLIAKHKVS